MSPSARRTVTIVNPSGLHARPAAELSRLAGSVESSVRILAGVRSANASSVLGILTLGIETGDTVDIECHGPDAEADLTTLVEAVRSGLGEIAD